MHLLLVGLGLVGGLALGRGSHAGGGHAVEQALDLGGAVRELEAPEVVARVLDELDEGDEQAPGVRPIHDQPLQQHSRQLLLDDVILHAHTID